MQPKFAKGITDKKLLKRFRKSCESIQEKYYCINVICTHCPGSFRYNDGAPCYTNDSGWRENLVHNAINFLEYLNSLEDEVK